MLRTKGVEGLLADKSNQRYTTIGQNHTTNSHQRPGERETRTTTHADSGIGNSETRGRMQNED